MRDLHQAMTMSLKSRLEQRHVRYSESTLKLLNLHCFQLVLSEGNLRTPPKIASSSAPPTNPVRSEPLHMASIGNVTSRSNADKTCRAESFSLSSLLWRDKPTRGGPRRTWCAKHTSDRTLQCSSSSCLLNVRGKSLYVCSTGHQPAASWKDQFPYQTPEIVLPMRQAHANALNLEQRAGSR